ncbi:MAG TPA: 4-alpha-glucanotransferase [Steroidobacteraceae bacterium]|nr:4-alpha-glucanotransferase [Steroidobacteraceae bacterium]
MTDTRLPVFDRRRAGVLLHLGSLPDALGRGGRAFIDWLAAAGFSGWQILPVGPTGADGSPYWVRSDFAGNPVFIDSGEWPDQGGLGEFLAASAHWLEDYALFEVLSFVQGGAPWWSWAPQWRDRAPEALAHLRQQYAAELDRVKNVQFAFFVQWRRLREHARARGVRLFGDLPFYVAPDSAETWAHRDQFQLDATGQPAAVAGVPPDYFSQTGQLWGNPLYDWDVLRRDQFRLWRRRVASQLQRVDVLRIDHFRALAAHWAVPAGAPDARSGEWRPTPGEELLGLLWQDLGDLPIVAEDLGVITPDVDALRKEFGLPGMRVLQFAFSGESTNPHLPHMHERDSVVYTGTHDNDTTLGWYASLPPHARQQVDDFLRLTPGSMPDALIRAALGSVGGLAIVPVQDLLSLGSEARLNTPGTAAGNWSWRLAPGALTGELAGHFRHLNGIYNRG